MALTQTPITIEATPASAIATNGTQVFTYPSGYNASSFIYGGATLYSDGLKTLFTEGASNFSVVYGASSATVTYLGSTSIPAGTRLRFGPSMVPTVGVQILPVYLNLADVASGDVMTDYTPGFPFKVLSVDFRVQKAVTTGSKAATLNLEIGSTNLTGGAVALTSTNCTPAGAAVAGTAITAANTGTATDTISIEASSVTAFVEGTGTLYIKLLNLDTYNEVAAR